MSASLSSRTRELTVTDLVELGFSEAEIMKLSALRAAYPFVEYVESSTQWSRLQFLKWRIENGDLQRD